MFTRAQSGGGNTDIENIKCVDNFAYNSASDNTIDFGFPPDLVVGFDDRTADNFYFSIGKANTYIPFDYTHISYVRSISDGAAYGTTKPSLSGNVLTMPLHSGHGIGSNWSIIGIQFKQ